MQKKKILSLAIATATVVTGLVGVTTATNSPEVLDNGDLKVCGTEYISNADGAEGCIIIQGKNVGATTTGAGPSASSDSYGYYFQWGDNNTGYTEQNWNGSNVQPDNAWGGGSDNDGLVYPVETGSERRGPCDEGYHVPSKGEWYALMDMWADSSVNGSINSNISQFYTAFQIPFAGLRYDFDGSLGYQGNYAYLWSSSPNVGNEYARYFVMNESYATAFNYIYRTYGFPVRCFKDSALGSSSSEGGDSEIIVNIAKFNDGQNTCSGSNYIFENIVAGTSTGTHTLSGVFQCAFGHGRTSTTVTLQLSGDLVADGDRVISGSNLMMKNSEWGVSPVGLKFADTLISTWKALTATQILFKKTANLIGVASGVVEVQLTVPGGTPDGTYNGVLVLTY